MIQIIDHKSCTLPLSCFHLCVPHVSTWLGLSSDTDSLHFALIICAQRQSTPSNVITITDLTHDTIRFRWYLLPQIHYGFHRIYYTSWKVLLNDFKPVLVKKQQVHIWWLLPVAGKKSLSKQSLCMRCICPQWIQNCYSCGIFYRCISCTQMHNKC